MQVHRDPTKGVPISLTHAITAIIFVSVNFMFIYNHFHFSIIPDFSFFPQTSHLKASFTQPKGVFGKVQQDGIKVHTEGGRVHACLTDLPHYKHLLPPCLLTPYS